MVNVLSLIGENSSIDLQLGKECRKECGRHSDCFTQYFNFFEVKVPAPNQTQFAVNIFAPDFPDLVYRNSPRMAVDEMLCFVASIVSIWFGFSFWHFSEQTIGSLKTFNQYLSAYKIGRINNVVIVDKSRNRFIDEYIDKRISKIKNIEKSNTNKALEKSFYYYNKY